MKPILFSAPMVRAILDGRKTQTRRVVKPQPTVTENGCPRWGTYDGRKMHMVPRRAGGGSAVTMTDLIGEYCPYGRVGDQLWVRETWHPFGTGKHPNWMSDRVLYRADNEGLQPFDGCASHPLPSPVEWSGRQTSAWKPSIFMPRWASRLTLEITSVRVEQVADITTKDCAAEGVQLEPGRDTEHLKRDFIELWDSINAKRGYGWSANPWCWVVAFKRVQ